MREILITTMMTSVLTGCASSGNQQFKNETEISVQSKLQEGKTTKSEVESYFGSPDTVSYTDSGDEVQKRAFAKVKISGATFIPSYGLFYNGTNGTRKELAILFNDDTIKKYTISEARINSKSNWAD